MFVLYKAKISGERLQDHWSSGLLFHCPRSAEEIPEVSYNIGVIIGVA